MLQIHDYYMVVSLPLVVFLAALGFAKLWSASESRRTLRYFIWGFLGLVAILGSYRSLSRFERGKPKQGLESAEAALGEILPSTDTLIIAASDRSPSIYLYFMHRKGWSVTAEVSAETIRQIIEEGAEYLVSDSRFLEGRDELRPLLSQVADLGAFRVFRLLEIPVEPDP
jgi:hypothetical protein